MPTSSTRKTGRKATTKRTTPARSRSTVAEDTPSQSQTVPSPEPVDSKYAATTWGTAGGTTDLEVPSGQVCLVRRVGVEGLMRAGVLHNVDALSSIVNEKHIKWVKGRKEGEIDPASLMGDQKSLEQVMHTVDRVVCHCVVKPTVVMTPNDVTSRQDGVIYADMVDLADKMFIFNFVVGGTRDLDSFRERLEVAVGSLDDEQDVREATE